MTIDTRTHMPMIQLAQRVRHAYAKAHNLPVSDVELYNPYQLFLVFEEMDGKDARPALIELLNGVKDFDFPEEEDIELWSLFDEDHDVAWIYAPMDWAQRVIEYASQGYSMLSTVTDVEIDEDEISFIPGYIEKITSYDVDGVTHHLIGYKD